jgi:hypothetical protein
MEIDRLMKTCVKNLFLQPASVFVLAMMMMATSLFGAPTLTITAPKADQKWSNADFTVTGTAKDTVAISNVLVSLNDGGWTAATLSDGGSNWTTGVTLTPGTNTIAAYARDVAGNLSTTNTVKFVYVVNAILIVQTNGDGSVTPNDNDVLLQVGVRYSLKAVAAKGFGFVKWTDGEGNVLTNGATLTFFMAPDLTFVANFKDITPPTLTITAPKANEKWSNADFTVTGTAKDNVTVSNVFVSLNNGDWTPATLSDGGSNWSAGVTLTPGTNTIAAYAVGTGDLLSTTDTVKVIYILSAPLIVETNGDGTVSPDYNGDLLEIGASYTMKATAAKGFAFHYWSGGVPMTNDPTLKFTMASNLTIIANFKDITPPTVSITTPTSGEAYSVSVIEGTGTATDLVGVTSVEVRINGGGWVEASGTTNWSVDDLPVATGTNTVEAAAMDAAGNVSKTNQVKFIGVPPLQTTWAPATISNSVITMTPVSPAPGAPHYACFGSTTFSYADTNDLDDSGIGEYDYQFVDTNYSVIQVAFTAPPTNNGVVANIDLVFTNFDMGSYTNEDTGEFGAFNINPAAQLAPSSLDGKTFTVKPVNAAKTTTLSFTASGVTIKQSTGGSIPGTYTVDVASPMGEFDPLDFSADGEAGTIYFQVTYLTATNGIYEVNDYLMGAFEKYDSGTFTVK